MKRLFLSLLFALPLAGQTITVQDPSFETYTSTASGGGCSWNLGPIPGWTISGVAGQGQCDKTVLTSAADGPTIAWANSGATISQNLGVPAQAVTYALAVSIGHRGDGFAAGSTATISLLAGSTSLCSNSVVTASVAAGTWRAESLSCPVTAPIPSGNLTISLACTGGQCIFDNVTLTGGPPPPFVWPVAGLGTATFPMQIPVFCTAADGACSIAFKWIGPIAPCGTNCFTGNYGTLSIIKTVSLPVPQVQETVIVVVSQP